MFKIQLKFPKFSEVLIAGLSDQDGVTYFAISTREEHYSVVSWLTNLLSPLVVCARAECGVCSRLDCDIIGFLCLQFDYDRLPFLQASSLMHSIFHQVLLERCWCSPDFQSG